MAEKTLPPEGLSGAQADATERRAFLRRAVGIGVPVVLATVKGRTVLAQGGATPSGCASFALSGWRARNPEDAFECDANRLMTPGGEEIDDNLMTPAGSESLFEEPTTSDGLSKPSGESSGSGMPSSSHGSGS